MEEQRFKCILISDFNISNFSGYIKNEKCFPEVDTITTPFGQVIQVLMNNAMDCWQENPDFAVIWTRPEGIIKSFYRLQMFEKVSIDDILTEVDEYSSLLLEACNRVRFLFVPTWVFPTYHKGFGMLDMQNGNGIANSLMRMNIRLSENLDKANNIYLLNSQKWIEVAGKRAFDSKLWYMGKILFGNEVFAEAVKDVKSALRGISGKSRKLIILDLDDTLWGGVVGDMGWNNLTLGDHDPYGEAYVAFQRSLKSLTNRGVILGIVSKNEEATALEVVHKHPEMVLRLEDFAGWKINWQDKAQNIVDLVSDLNLGLQSVVFIDNDPIERARVRDALPEVLVPEWPEDKMLYNSMLLSLRCFDTPINSSEDTDRTRMYVTEKQRQDLKKNIGSLDEWLKSLKIQVKIEELNTDNLQRTVQLLNKTNQMNLSTRRMTETELLDWAGSENHKLWTFRVSDKFSDSGLTGITSIETNSKTCKIVDFVLSCRVMGRKLEETMICAAINYGQSVGVEEIYAEYIPTPRNSPCLDFLESSGFKYDAEKNHFIWYAKDEYTLPDCIQIDLENS
ncbi:MAG: HAD-IIIC family phosphatase [Candidatus Scalindua sp.]